MKKKDLFLAEAESFYVKGKTLSEISEILGISQRTLSRWKKSYGWQEKRKKYFMNPLSIQDQIDEEIAKLVQRLAMVDDEANEAKIIDQLSKLAKVKESYGKMGDLSTQAIYVFDKFTGYIREKEKDQEIIDRLQKLIQGFIRKALEERK